MTSVSLNALAPPAVPGTAAVEAGAAGDLAQVALSPLTTPGFAERMLGLQPGMADGRAAPALAPAQAANEALGTSPVANLADLGPQAQVAVQVNTQPGADLALARQATEPSRQDATALTLPVAGSATAPAAQPLQPQAPSGLQVDPGFAWSLPRRPQHPLRPVAARHPGDPAGWPDDDTHAPEQAPAPDEEPDADLEWQDQTPEPDWCTPLSQALGKALAGADMPPALAAAAQQWRQGRCVVLACPQGEDFTAPGWAHVLWPRARGRRRRVERSATLQPLLHGVRVQAQLQWASLPPQGWCHARMVKQHHPRHGRQLVALAETSCADPAAPPAGPVPCEMQLGPVRASQPRWQYVCVRVLAVRALWAALGAQWSAHVLVCSRPLLDTRPEFSEAAC